MDLAKTTAWAVALTALVGCGDPGAAPAPVPTHATVDRRFEEERLADVGPLLDELRRAAALVRVLEVGDDVECLVTTPDGAELHVGVDMTTKGNGVIRSGGLLVRLYDVHDDGHVQEPAGLRVRFEDLDQDGVADLVADGEVRETESPFRRSPVRVGLRVDPVRGVLVLQDQEGPVPIAW